MNSSPQPRHPPAPVACLHCRDKHVKCDGNPTGCLRCTMSNVECCYLPSRRGRRCPPRSQPLIDYPNLLDSPTPIDPSSQTEPPSLCLPTCNTFMDNDNLFPGSPNLDSESAACLPSQQQPCPPSDLGENHLVTLYYFNFHSTHPFLLPRKAFLESGPPKYLLDLMELISLHYVSPNLATCDRITQLQTTVQEASLSVEKVQALLLLCITLHAHIMPQAAKGCLAQAIDYSIQLRLNCRDASDVVMAQDPIRAESLRRTWWEIFIVDTLLAAVQVDGTLLFKSEETPNIPLPCEQEEYELGGDYHTWASITARDLEHSQHLLFFEEAGLSSLDYRVEASMLLRKCLLAASQGSIDALDASISSWFHRLPSGKRGILHCNGDVDQMMFQAVMLVHCASIYLHFPRSRLMAFLPVTSHLFCSSPPSVASTSAIPQLHTTKVVKAALDLSKLASLSTSVAKQSPFFCCILVLSSVIQLASHSARLEELDLQFLGLNLSMLKSMEEIWTMAAVSKLRLRSVVKEVLDALGVGF